MKQYFDFTGKVVLVTGGSRGLGLAISKAFAEQGANVIVASRKADACVELAQELERSTGRQALGVGAHMGKWTDIERLVAVAYDRFGKVDILVNNAGMSPISSSSADTSETLFDKVLEVNFKGPFRLTALVASRMAAQDGGSVINISSIGAIRPLPAFAPYAGAKAALNAVTIAQAFEYAPKVRINAILPGSFRTDIAKSWPPEKEKSINSAIKRYGDPDEIVSTVLYLASDSASFTTGSLIRVDGGRP
jgi:NAD(P)-dependent dehydrogenase (short-subunit alcohol dehydrogenase family)